MTDAGNDCAGGKLHPDDHDLREVDHEQLLELTRCAAYAVSHECKHCEAAFSGIDVRGDLPETESEFKTVAYELYDSFYETPRSISHLALMKLIPVDDQATRTQLAGDLAAAVDLGYDDAESNHEKRNRRDVLHRVIQTEFSKF